MIMQISVSEDLEAEAVAAWGSVVSALPGESAADRAKRGVAAMLRAKIGEVSRIAAQSSVASTIIAGQNSALARADAPGAFTVTLP
jgi:hypothetical protein